MTELSAAAHMDGIYRRQRHVYDLTRKYYLLGRDRLLTELQPPEGGRVLEIACGTGRNLILAARRYPGAACHGFDVSEAMLDTARCSVVRAGLDGRVALAKGDATNFNAAELFGADAGSGFDRVFISYALSMIPDWRKALSCALSSLGPSGRLHVVDFGQQEQWPALFRKGLFAWLRRFDVFPRADLEDELRLLSQSRGMALAFHKLYGGYASYATLEAPENPAFPEE
jgi:S-adenosylmethionine-diacylgycerolhomoserine-N-methlytransferase